MLLENVYFVGNSKHVMDRAIFSPLSKSISSTHLYICVCVCGRVHVVHVVLCN